MAVMAFSFISFYYVSRNLTISKVDDTLIAQVEEITNILEEQTLSPATKEFIFDTFSISKTNLVIIANNNGNIIAQSQAFDINQEIYLKLLEISKQEAQPTFITEDTNRFYLVPLYNEQTYLGTIIVGDSILAINSALSVLINTMLLIFFIFVLPLILISYLEADISLQPLRDLVKTVNTITTKNLSERVETLNPKDEIGEVSTSINHLLDRLQRGFTKERQLIHDVSHQLKTPLTALRSDIEISLGKKRTIEEYEDILNNVYMDTKRMSDILKDMVNLAWAASEDQERNFTIINLSNIVEEAAEIATQVGFDKDIEVNTSITPKITIKGQREKIIQALLNIMENAVKYSKKHGKIYVKMLDSYPETKIIIKDTGIGITQKDLPYIFDRFYRGKSKIKEGSGLGLSIAGALIKAHKGTIEVTSKRQKGTTFVITLPMAKPTPKSKAKLNQEKPKPKFERPHVRTYLRNRFQKQQEKK